MSRIKSPLTFNKLMAEINYEFYDNVMRYREDKIATIKSYTDLTIPSSIPSFCGFPISDVTYGYTNDDFLQNRFTVRRLYTVPKDAVFYGARLSAEFLEEINIPFLFKCDLFEIWRSEDADSKGQMNCFYMEKK